ncbi:phosphoserine phosphatase 1 [Paenibacillus elgii]|uniref:histidine phosphatase family protein n=1 Tax=Paenibacillus elgii TaxID=189691 RepID=UPI002D7D459A|nr:phosphoserine phosphatase 1 [Paenibacillus elgii]
MNGETRIYIARHGQTEGILAGRMESRLDSPLTSRGVAQAEALAIRLKDVRFNAIYTSPSHRAIRTAEIVKGNKDIRLIPNECLYEIDIGDWDGHTRDEIMQSDPFQFEQFHNNPEKYIPKRGESFKDAERRVISFFTFVKQRHFNETILAVSHSGIIKLMINNVKAVPLNRYWEPPTIPNGSLSCIRMDQSGMLVELEADIQHLPSLVT